MFGGLGAGGLLSGIPTSKRGGGSYFGFSGRVAHCGATYHGENAPTTNTFELAALAAMIFLTGSVASMAWRAMADLPHHRLKEDRNTSVWLWSAAAALPALWAWPTWIAVLGRLKAGQWADGDAVFVFLVFIFFPLAIGYGVGVIFRMLHLGRLLASCGLMTSRSTTPWEERVISPSVLKEGIDIYFSEGDCQYLGAAVSADHHASQVLLHKLRIYSDDVWVPMDSTRNALYFPREAKVLWFTTVNPVT